VCFKQFLLKVQSFEIVLTLGRRHFFNFFSFRRLLRTLSYIVKDSEFCQWRMWSIAKLLLCCANYSIKLQSTEFFMVERNTASGNPYSEKVGVKSIFWWHCVGGFVVLCFDIFKMKSVDCSGASLIVCFEFRSLCYCFSCGFLFLGCDFQSNSIN